MNRFSQRSLSEKVSYSSIIANILLSLTKALAGIFGHSVALLSDAVHSLSDVVSTFIVLIGLKISEKQPDQEHEYGHERFECIAAILLSFLLALTGIAIGRAGVLELLGKSNEEKTLPSVLTLYAAALSILIKEAMFQVTRWAAKKEKSPSLMADAYHHRSDALSSIGALVGVWLTRKGFAFGEPLASLVICLFILKASVEIFQDATDKLTDTSCSSDLEDAMRKTILLVPGVDGIDSFRTRQFGARIYVDAEIQVDGELKLSEAHTIAERVHDEIERNYPDVKHCMVHVNPD